MQYVYQVIDNSGRLMSGVIDAKTYRHAARELEGRGLTLVKLEVKQTGVARAKTGQRKSISRNELILVFYEMATMIRAGVSIKEAVESICSSAHSDGLVDVFDKILVRLRGGESFARSLKSSSMVLPEYMHYLVEAGEITGKLAEALEQGVEQMEYDLQVQSDTRSALIYPAILVMSGIAAVGIMFLFVVPKFASLLEADAELPLLASIVLNSGLWVHSHIVLIGVLSLLLCVGLVYASKNQSVRIRALDIFSRMPLIGSWINETDIAVWSKMLGVLLVNRVELLAALELSSRASRVPWRVIKLAQVGKSVKAGMSLSAALQKEDVVTPTALNLVAVGERAGDLPTTLASVARLYDQASRNRMKRLLALIEPVAILVIGSAIGVIILGIILAITSANDIAV